MFGTVRLINRIEIKPPRINAAGVLDLIASWRKKKVTQTGRSARLPQRVSRQIEADSALFPTVLNKWV